MNRSFPPNAFGSFDDPSVPGWFNFARLYNWLVDAVPDPAEIVEIGAWYGRSSAYLARIVQASGKRINITVIDTWRGSPGEPDHDVELARNGGDLFPAFCANMARLGILELIRPIQLPSVEAASGISDLSVDFVFIDAAHDYASVAADLRAWWPKVKMGGWIGGHDYPTWEGVRQAVEDYFGRVSAFPAATSWLVRKTTDRCVKRRI